MEVEVGGVAEVIREARIWWINKGISGHALAIYILLGMAIWNTPATIKAINERRKIDQENKALTERNREKIRKERERRERRRTTQ
jgi:hypothetical protein